MAEREICELCRGQIETSGRSSRICYGCILDSLIPAGYEEREDYRYDSAWGHNNATKHPPTGIPLLDQTPLRLSESPIPQGVKPRWL